MFGLGALIQVGMLIAGCWWCKEIFGRFHSDVVEIKSGDWTQRSVVLLIWAVTGVVLYWIFSSVLSVATNAYHAW